MQKNARKGLPAVEEIHIPNEFNDLKYKALFTVCFDWKPDLFAYFTVLLIYDYYELLKELHF
jgi:hypothetical protein